MKTEGGNDTAGTAQNSGTVREGGGIVITDDPLVLQASAEASGGSDTDTSRADLAELSEKDVREGIRHARSNSVKKPISFKAVSVTKSFLAKATAGSPPASKGNTDKGKVHHIILRNYARLIIHPLSTTAAMAITNNQPAPRPRLVAKSGSGLRDATPKTMNSTNKSGRGSGPDPNQVWNKNRRKSCPARHLCGRGLLISKAVQPPPPKQFTDEELKQQYGIHLATRLQADGDGKEAKWADIDDDEDDWAPDTIEWNDGTKITLAPTENALAPAEDRPTISATKGTKVEVNKANVPQPKQPSAVGPNATILKVGASTGVQPKVGNLVLKGSSEKPTLVAKPPVPAPVKSPWAPLPPVDKVSPLPINPPQQQSSAARFGQKDPHGFDAMPPPPSPAKEIAADDFNRSWRDHQAGNHRELFNSQSGRYEPVHSARRGSIRAEQNFRPPSLLQRPLHTDQQGPAEPSAAFQTSRSNTSQDASTWNRRRTSSNVSGDSGGYGRRMSFGRGQELPSIPSDDHQERRGSQPGAESNRDASPRNTTSVSEQSQQQYSPRGLSPAQQNQHLPWQTRHSPSSSHAHLRGPNSASEQTAQAVNVPGEHGSFNPSAGEANDPIAMQKRLMRERRELAVKRRQEQEEKDEAEKKERIRAKMEALGLPPLDEERGKKEKMMKTEKETKGTADKAKGAMSSERPLTNGVVASAQSPPKPPVPEISGEPKQYGMMKVHHPQTVKRLPPVKEPAVDPIPESVASDSQVSPPSPDTKTEVKDRSLSSMPNGIHDTAQHLSAKLPVGESVLQSPPEEPKEQPWKNVPSGSDTYTSWGGSSMTTHSSPGGNLWGPPGSDKALGNGTFDRDLARLPQRHIPHHQHVSPPAPGPIGPPPATAPLLTSHPGGLTSEPAYEVSQAVPAFPAPEVQSSQSVGQTNHEIRDQERRPSQELRHPKPIAPPAGPANKTRPAHALGASMITSGWNNFHATAAREESERTERERKERAARLEEELRTGIKQESKMPAISETWRQTSIDGNGGQRKIIGIAKTRNTAQGLSDGQHGLQTDRNPPFDTVMSASMATSAISSGAGAGRGSRFFPQIVDGASSPIKRSVSYSPGYVRPASPPPPDSVDHPAYAGDIRRPTVSLPFIKPKPTVKLPPATILPVPPPSISPMPTPSQPLRVVSQPLVNTASWQDRFNGLFKKKASLEKRNAPTVDSTTKIPLEVVLTEVSAAVSLPRSEDGDQTASVLDSGTITSKAMEDEEALFEEREFGSLPTVRLPRNAPPAVWVPAQAPSIQRPRSKLFKATQVLSIEPLIWSLYDQENKRPDGYVISVRLPGEDFTKATLMASNHGSLHVPRPQRNPPSHIKPRKGMKSRESAGNFGPAKVPQTQPPIPPLANNAARANFHGGTWARRVSGVVQ